MLAQKKRIISHLLASDPPMMRFLFDPPTGLSLRESPDALVSESWELTDEQRVLVRAALDIWCAQGNVFLWEVIHGLGRENLARLITALLTWNDLHAAIDRFSPRPAENNL